MLRKHFRENGAWGWANKAILFDLPKKTKTYERMSREVNMNEVYKALGGAIKKRDHALAMLKRWQGVLDAAEEDISKLSNELSMVRTSTDYPELGPDGTQSYEQVDHPAAHAAE